MNNIPQNNIETKIANRLKSIFAAFGQTINDFYLEAGIYCIGGFNAALVAWDIYTDLLASDQPLLYAVIIAVIAFVAVEGLAVYLVGAAAKTSNGLLWVFSVVFAGFFTFAHYKEMIGAGIIAEYITLAIPFFVVIGYWARTIKVSVEIDQVQSVKDKRDELARQQQIEDEERRVKLEIKRLHAEQKHAERMAQIEAQKKVHPANLNGSFAPNDTKNEPKMSLLNLANETRKMNQNERLNSIRDLIESHTQAEIAEALGVSISTVKRDIKQLNGSLKKVK